MCTTTCPIEELATMVTAMEEEPEGDVMQAVDDGKREVDAANVQPQQKQTEDMTDPPRACLAGIEPDEVSEGIPIFRPVSWEKNVRL